jgi:hypothetical protein
MRCIKDTLSALEMENSDCEHILNELAALRALDLANANDQLYKAWMGHKFVDA